MSAERLPPVLSASKLKTFVGCGRRYKYQYIERVPVLKHPAAALGTAIHNTIDAVYKEKRDPIKFFVDAFDEEIRNANILLNYDEYQKYREDGIKMVGDYPYNDWMPIATEVEFRLPFPDKHRPLCEIHGFIDQTHEWGFADLKSNKQRPKQEELDNDLQFIIYQWAYEQLRGKPAEKCVWYHLRTQQAINADVIGKNDVALNVIRELLQVRRDNTFTKNRTFFCRWCPFRDPCYAEDDVEIS